MEPVVALGDRRSMRKKAPGRGSPRSPPMGSPERHHGRFADARRFLLDNLDNRDHEKKVTGKTRRTGKAH